MTSLVGFLLALSVINPPVAEAKANRSKRNTAKPKIEERMTAIAKILKEREKQLWDSSEKITSSSSSLSKTENATELAQSFRNVFRNGGGGFRNGGRWGNWRNGWRDGGGFFNFRNW